MKNLSKNAKSNAITYGIVIVFYLVMQLLVGAGVLSSSLTGQLIPICVYICMAVSLNLTVGILGELSLGHAGFMSVGAFTGVIVAMSLQPAIASGPIRLLLAMAVGGVMAAIVGVLVGVPLGVIAAASASVRWRALGCRTDRSPLAPVVPHSPQRLVISRTPSQLCQSSKPAGLTWASMSQARNSVLAKARQGRPSLPAPSSHSPVRRQR